MSGANGPTIEVITAPAKVSNPPKAKPAKGRKRQPRVQKKSALRKVVKRGAAKKARQSNYRPDQLSRLTGNPGYQGIIPALRGVTFKMHPNVFRILCSLCLPQEFNMERSAGRYAQGYVATASPFARNPINMGVQSLDDPTQHQLPKNNWVAFMFRNPLQSAIIYDSVVQTFMSYKFNYSQIGSTPTTGFTIKNGPREYPINPIWLVSSTAAQVHGPILYAERSKKRPELRFFWVDSKSNSSTVEVTLTAGAPVHGVITLFVWKWTPNGIVQDSENAITVASGGITVTFATGSGRYALSTYNNDPLNMEPVCTSILVNTINSDCFAHRSTNTIEANITTIASNTVPSYSLLLSNTSADFYKNGRVIGVQMNPGDDWFDNIQYGKLDSVNKTKFFPAKTGIYAIPKPTNDLDFTDKENIASDSGNIQKAYVDMEDNAAYIAVALDVSASPDADPTGQALQLTNCTQVGYGTTDQWRPVSEPTCTTAEWDEALRCLQTMDQFYENPHHLHDILAKIGRFTKKIMPHVEKYGPTIAKWLMSKGG